MKDVTEVAISTVLVEPDKKPVRYTVTLAINTMTGELPPPAIIEKALDARWNELKKQLINEIYAKTDYSF